MIYVTADSSVLGHFFAMAFQILRELDNGELLSVATHSDREQAEQQVQALRELWPGEYVIQEIGDPG